VPYFKTNYKHLGLKRRKEPRVFPKPSLSPRNQNNNEVKKEWLNVVQCFKNVLEKIQQGSCVFAFDIKFYNGKKKSSEYK